MSDEPKPKLKPLAPTELTAEEIALFTRFDLVAYDTHRKDCKQRDEIPPCWLTMSPEARDRIRSELVVHLRFALGRLDLTTEQAHAFIDGKTELDQYLERWKAVELEFKAARQAGNPRAFFAEGPR